MEPAKVGLSFSETDLLREWLACLTLVVEVMLGKKHNKDRHNGLFTRKRSSPGEQRKQRVLE
jgi:hypothetical protein